MDNARKLERLVSETEDLLDEVQDQDNPQLDDVRDRLHRSLKRTKALLADDRDDETHVGVRDVAASVNAYVRGYPWLALITGVLVASTLGILATQATRRSYDNE